MLVWIPITVRISEPTTMLQRKVARGAWLARSMPVISVGSETLNSTLMVAILHHGIDRSIGTRLVENSSESMAILLKTHAAVAAATPARPARSCGEASSLGEECPNVSCPGLIRVKYG